MFGRRVAIEKARQCRHEIVGHGAAQTAIGQLDDIIVAARGVTAAQQQLAIYAELAELVDDDGETSLSGMRQQMPHEAGFARAEKAGDDRRRYAAHRLSLPSS